MVQRKRRTERKRSKNISGKQYSNFTVFLAINSFSFIICTLIIVIIGLIIPVGTASAWFGLIRYGIPIFSWIALFRWSKKKFLKINNVKINNLLSTPLTEVTQSVYSIFSQIPRQYIYRLGAALGFVIILYMIFWGDEPEIFVEEPVPTPISVEVLNGCGVSGVAAQMTEFLRLNDIDVLITEDADNSDYPETIIIGRDSQFDHTEIISQLTGITNRTPDAVTGSIVNVTIIIGKDYKNFKPFIN